MVKIPRKAYTLEFKQEAVRLVDSGQRVSEAARSLGVVEQTLSNWVKAHRSGKLRGSGRSAELTSEQMEIRRLRAELARVTMGATSWEKPRRSLRRARSEIRLYRSTSYSLAGLCAVPRARRQRHRLSPTSIATGEDRATATPDG